MSQARRASIASALAAVVVAAFATSAVPAHAAMHPALHPTGARSPRHFVAVQQLHFGMSALSVPPVSVSLKNYAVPVGDQGWLGSCVAWAVDYGMLGWYAQKAGRLGAPFQPMYVYSQINGGQDAGAWPLDAFSVLQSQGSDTQAHYSHDNFDWWDQPIQSEFENAAHYKISNYHTLFSGPNQAGNINAIKTTLAASHPIAIEIPVRPGFDNMGHSASSVDTDSAGTIRGYHEILAVGYDAAGLVIQNSWGTGWGAAGFGKLSWTVVQNDVLEADYADGLAADAAAPDMLSVRAAPLATGTIGATTVPYKVSWTSVGVVANYSLSYTINGGSGIPLSLPNVKATSYTFNAAPGATYTFKVHATDALVRASGDLESSPVTVARLQQDDGSIAYQGVWTTPSVATASGGRVALTTKVNATATLSTTARAISWVASKGPSFGQAKVYVDGVLKTTVNLYATTAAAKALAYTIDFGSAGAHTLKIVAVGTPYHPGVAVDAFVVTT
jgi:hypothetical protein